ncbi:SMP-30/gluconolactonase/LRE family protein [Pelomonas sp. UHG3]|uniref:SMP-30/gluconolactonase/LRE family protein n=1 Tax=Roseateles hydrophilus TaxID=2975054 RepID=A0ACC6CAA7_9BURK|nr:SMP-30/gluconolactonase/LRE family protein [Pelomonas sp. UHG3]MCY4745345.1 SMP-30/gluconolactonase/LRE family protein [Pelomonas sp. UHG3]
MQLSGELELALPFGATLGEGLLWQGGRWWWTDIEGATLHAWRPGAAAAESCRLPDRLGSFAHTASGRVLLGLAKRLCIATLGDDLSLTQLQTLAPVDAAESRTRINDGRTDRRGYFVFGTLNEAKEKRPIASFYQFSLQHGLRRLALPAVAIANSICFSLDGRTMYFCDSLSQRIQQCDYDAETAQVDHVRLFTQMDRPDAWPDGSVIDAEGCLWNAQWGAGRVARYDPAGRLMGAFDAPAAHTSCPALGGEALDHLMITTARAELGREALAAQPLSGSLFGRRLPRALGVPDTLFQD